MKVPSGEEDLAPPEELPKGFSTFHEYYASLRRGPRTDDDDNAGGGGGGGRGVMAH